MGKSIEEAVRDLVHLYDELRRNAETDRKDYRLAKARKNDAEVAQAHVQEVALLVQKQAHEKIATIVTRCLRIVFDDPPEFRIVFERKRGKTEARLAFFKKGNETSAKAEGGGLVDVAALALRLACVMADPQSRRILVLDEPFRNIHGKRNRERAAQLIELLSHEMKVQFIVVTGLDWLKIGEVIEL